MAFVSRGFLGRSGTHRGTGELPPGQYDVGDGFPVLSAGPTPRTATEDWDFTIDGEVAERARWTWQEFRSLPREDVVVDIHCVTKWSKFRTAWSGVSLDTLLAAVDTSAEYAVAVSDGGYTTNLPLEDLVDGRAWIVDRYEGEPLAAEHGGPARLLCPHLYFWKSAKWVRGLRLSSTDEPGFWETLGYHDYGDPWREQRYAGD
ncbi:sulfite oxidase-like oxidoreductase [Actinomycetospora lutea]|uniref:sulfite oxidase-like oxidoreductase n=1 Tax=Actinomycetospora lutea TaxID=663604 RepID=UPI002365AD84|nr:sulfite oxidase-like oxidoreductase [Actinomycetospora lutea]MDD7940141.1 sulfite oxidase-like oxidoreductase [Actinomycetospora lutea]